MAYTAVYFRDMARYKEPLCRRRCVQKGCSRTLSPVQMLATSTSLNHRKPLPQRGRQPSADLYEYCWHHSLSVASFNCASNFAYTGGLASSPCSVSHYGTLLAPHRGNVTRTTHRKVSIVAIEELNWLTGGVSLWKLMVPHSSKIFNSRNRMSAAVISYPHKIVT
jgi:hypothetical protein